MVGYCKKYAWYMSKRDVDRMGCVDRDKQCLYNRKRCRHFVTDNFFVSVGDVARFSGKDGERMYNAQLQKEMKDLLSAWQEWEIGFIFGNTKWKKGIPMFSQEALVGYLKIQAKREELLEKIEGDSKNVKNMSIVD